MNKVTKIHRDDLCRLLRGFRQLHRVSLRDLGRRLGRTPSQVSEMELGQRDIKGAEIAAYVGHVESASKTRVTSLTQQA